MEQINKILKKRIKDEDTTMEISYKFKMMSTDELRVTCAMEICKKFQITPEAKCQKKNTETSTCLRKEGNQIFVQNNTAECFINACKMYSKSIAYAPNNSNEQALAFANRSAVLFRLGKYEECVEDIKRALKLNYPECLKAKLLLRKTKCLAIFKKLGMQEAYNKAQEWFQKMTLDDTEREKIQKKLDNAIQHEDESNENTTKQTCWFDKILEDFLESKRNNEVPCASEALSIKYSEKFGRHVVATRDIRAGEILTMEKPYALILMLENVYTHCSNCLEVSWASIPCEHCVYAMYCSEKCKFDAWKKYHDVECAVVGYLIDLEMNNLGLLSMRLTTLAVREAKSIQKLKEEMEEVDKCNDPRKKGFLEDGKLHSNKYRSIYSLTTNTEKRSVTDLFDRALKAAFIVYYLSTKTTFFGEKFNDNWDDLTMNFLVTYVGGLILRHQQIIPSNIHSYTEERNLNLTERGAAALPFFSFLNHSCDPNVSRISIKGLEMCFALYPIEKGTQIFDNYGIHYAVMTKSARQAKLKQQYYFDCECLACRKAWPLYYNIASYQTTVKSQVTKAKLDKVLSKKFDNYVCIATKGDIKNSPEILEDLSKMIQMLMKHVSLPCVEINNVVETLKCVFALSGNRFEVPQCN